MGLIGLMGQIGLMGLIGQIGPIGLIRQIGLMGQIRPIGLMGLIRQIRPMGLRGVKALMGLALMVLLSACGGGGSESVGGGDVLPPTPPPSGQGDDDTPYSMGPAMGFSAVFADAEMQRAAGSPARGANAMQGAGASLRGMRRAGDDPQPGDGEFTTDDLQLSGFGVYCWYTGSADVNTTGSNLKSITKNILMQNQQVIYSGGQWTYSPTKYWPLNASEKLTLRAYAPYVSYQLQTDANGLPWMPVMVTKDDYHNGTQHDPLWGTSKHGGSDYEETRYGTLYDNYTYAMSGDETSKDARDGIIDWYFHHGMSKLMFACSVIKDPGCSKVIVNSITIENLYTQGLLSLSSGTASKDVKPSWEQRSGDMTVTLNGATTTDGGTTWTRGDLAPMPRTVPGEPEHTEEYPFVIEITDPTQPTPYYDLLEKGLLIIPRSFYAPNEPLRLTIHYTIDDDATDLVATAEINSREFFGNTSYTLKMDLTPSTQALEITLVQSAFTPWQATVEGTHEVYNW